MKTIKILLGATLICLVVLCSLALAQRQGGPPRQGQEGPPRQGRPDGRPRGHRPPGPREDAGLDFASIEMVGGARVVKGLPYSADAVIESTQVLRDGTSITHKSTTTVARDGEGRLRRERRLDAIGPFMPSDEARTLIVIDDPVLGSHFVFDVEHRTAHKIPNPPSPPPGEDGPRGEFAKGKVESLGTKTIEGVEAEGTRSIITIPVGKIGNDRPIEIVSERWFSSTLQVVMVSKHNDPRMGDAVYRLTNIKRTEPDAALFRVPADYTVSDGPPPPPRRPDGPGHDRGMRPPMGPPPPRDGGVPDRPDE